MPRGEPFLRRILLETVLETPGLLGLLGLEGPLGLPPGLPPLPPGLPPGPDDLREYPLKPFGLLGIPVPKVPALFTAEIPPPCAA